MTNLCPALAIVFSLVLLIGLGRASSTHSDPVPSHTRNSIEGVESVAKLLIDLDQGIEKALQREQTTPWSHLYLAQAEAALSNSTDDSNADREEKFSQVLQDLTKIEDQIKEAISKANANRQFRLLMRLRPLLSYVTHVHRNMEMLRTRVVAIATLSNLAVTVTEVIDQFGDVMTSSLGLAGGIVPAKDRPSAGTSPSSPGPSQVSKSSEAPSVASSVPDAPTTLSYTEVDSENFLKNIISQDTK